MNFRVGQRVIVIKPKFLTKGASPTPCCGQVGIIIRILKLEPIYQVLLKNKKYKMFYSNELFLLNNYQMIFDFMKE